MKKGALALTILTISMLVLISISFNIKAVEAANDEDYSIERVDHRIEVMYNGYIFINDTIQITGQASSGFLMGFPYKYGSHVLRCIAYNATETFPVTLNVPLENRVGFYGVKIDFPHGTPQTFTVGFVLSNNLLTQDASDTSLYTLDFPAYPSLTKPAAIYNASIVLPEGAQNISGTVESFAYQEENLTAFTYSPANITFSLAGDEIQIVDIKELKREITINEFGEIAGSDSYYITSKTITSITSIQIVLPPNASNTSAQDQFGRKMQQPEQTDEETSRYDVTLTLPLEANKFTRFTVKYYLPINYIAQEGANNFAITFPLFQHVNYYIEQASVTFVLPEGARILNPENILISGSYSVARSIFQETVTISRQGIISLDSFNVGIVYEFNPLWLSFRPTLWIWALAVVGCAVAVVWKRPTAPVPVAVPTVAVRPRPAYIKSFIDSYEEKRKITLEIESLETQVRKGRIPRRRYKVRRKTLETRLNTLSRSLTEFKEKVRTVGGQYVDLMRQLEVAETEIKEVESNIKSIEARHSRGELSLEAYRKLLADYQRRKERSETTIDGILLRLREETR